MASSSLWSWHLMSVKSIFMIFAFVKLAINGVYPFLMKIYQWFFNKFLSVCFSAGYYYVWICQEFYHQSLAAYRIWQYCKAKNILRLIFCTTNIFIWITIFGVIFHSIFCNPMVAFDLLILLIYFSLSTLLKGFYVEQH